MRTYDEILQIAADRKGGQDAVLADIPTPLTADALAAIPDDRWLAAMAKGIFQAGISWTVVNNKWPGIEEAFDHFAIGRTALMSEDRLDELLADTRIIRSPPKVEAIQHNAVLIEETAADVGSFGRKIGDWPTQDFAGLLDWLKKEGQRLGGNTGAYMLRFMGKDGFLMSDDVVARLIEEGVIDGPPTSKRSLTAVQGAFNIWADQSGQPLTTISRVLAQSIG